MKVEDSAMCSGPSERDVARNRKGSVDAKRPCGQKDVTPNAGKRVTRCAGIEGALDSCGGVRRTSRRVKRRAALCAVGRDTSRYSGAGPIRASSGVEDSSGRLGI